MKKKTPKVISQDQYDADDVEGQLALDVYQTKDNIVILAPIAGVTLDDMSVSVSDDVLTIKGKRSLCTTVSDEDYFTQECFWGDFSRSIVLPASVDTDKIGASFKDGVLTIKIPKIEKVRSKVIRIKTPKKK
ncbi:Hsp20/alpha crystallin family protein [Patescibacteria group bacterium]